MFAKYLVGLVLILLTVPGGLVAQGVLFVEGDRVGVGVSTPERALHVQGTDGTTQFLIQEQSSTEAARTLVDLQNNGVAFFRVSDTSADGSAWTFQAEGPSFRFNKAGTGGAEVLLRSRNDSTAGLPTFTVDGSVSATNVVFTSARAAKTELEPVEPRSILDSIAGLEISKWAFKTEENGRQHIGPMAEDFAGAFALGSDASQISLIDASGVALAGIQGLYEIIEEKNEVIERLQSQNADLLKRLEAVEAVILQLSSE